jgi:hypothetical protein
MKRPTTAVVAENILWRPITDRKMREEQRGWQMLLVGQASNSKINEKLLEKSLKLQMVDKYSKSTRNTIIWLSEKRQFNKGRH